MKGSTTDSHTKHEQITRHIESLEVGTKVSVRQIAEEFDVSEGTAYRAIKEAENLGIVSTKRRIGTIRVEKKEGRLIDKLTFAEIVNVVDGVVYGGASGLHKTLNKFVIGAMQLEAMIKYIEADNLLIVGNRVQAHMCALGQGAGVLITGGFDTTPEVKELADELELPIIGSSYDTFTVATMINRAIEDRLIKKQIMLIEDILRKESVYSLKVTSTVKEMQEMIEVSTHTRYPVLDDEDKPVGIITTKDLIGAKPNQTVGTLMTESPFVISAKASVASAGHMMIWEGIELLPVIDGERQLIGVISREDVMKAMQYIQKQPQHAETYEVQIWSGFDEKRDAQGHIYYKGILTPQMMNYEGLVSEGVLSALMTRAAHRTVQEHRKGDLILDSSANYFLIPLQIEDEIDIVPEIIELSRKFCKMDMKIMSKGVCAARGMFTARVL